MRRRGDAEMRKKGCEININVKVNKGEKREDIKFNIFWN